MVLDHFQGAAVDFFILTSLQTFQILQKMHKHNRKAVILTAQCHLISVLEVKNDITLYFCFRFSHFFLTNAAITFPCRFFSTTEDCSKCTKIKNQKSDVIALF